MKSNFRKEPRDFTVGMRNKITIKDFGEICLDPNEQISFVTEDNSRYDVVRKEWGFYATPSVNARLKDEGFKTALVKNEIGRIFVMLVKENMIDIFQEYCRIEKQNIIKWIDEDLNNI